MNTPGDVDNRDNRTELAPDGQGLDEDPMSPDRILDIPEAREVWQAETASFTHTEGSDDKEARLQRLAVRLGTVGSNDMRISRKGIQFLRQVECTIADYRKLYVEWMSEDPAERKEALLKQFAGIILGVGCQLINNYLINWAPNYYPRK